MLRAVCVETRCFPVRISARWRCIICHDTRPRDHVDDKQRTRTRHVAHFFTRTILMIIRHVHTLEKV